MNCFGQLFARFTDKLYDLCMEEALQENRLYCYINDITDPCSLCERHCFDDGNLNNHIGHDYLYLVCDDPQCVELWKWYHLDTRVNGYKRRQLFRKHFGKDIWKMEKSLRREALLTVMLMMEVSEKANERKEKLRVAA